MPAAAPSALFLATPSRRTAPHRCAGPAPAEGRASIVVWHRCSRRTAAASRTRRGASGGWPNGKRGSMCGDGGHPPKVLRHASPPRAITRPDGGAGGGRDRPGTARWAERSIVMPIGVSSPVPGWRGALEQVSGDAHDLVVVRAAAQLWPLLQTPSPPLDARIRSDTLVPLPAQEVAQPLWALVALRQLRRHPRIPVVLTLTTALSLAIRTALQQTGGRASGSRRRPVPPASGHPAGRRRPPVPPSAAPARPSAGDRRRPRRRCWHVNVTTQSLPPPPCPSGRPQP